MKPINEAELDEIVGGDSFWQDLGQFVGGFVGSIVNGYPTLFPAAPGGSAIAYGVIAAVVNE